MNSILTYLVLFSSALLAASLLPMQSEAVLSALIINGQYSVALLIAVASTGNILGSLLNWWLGGQLLRWQHKRWFPAKPAQLARAQQLYQRFGFWSLLASWLPVVGDPITLIAGVMREPLWRFVLLVSVAKTARYIALAYAVLAVSH